MNSNLAHEDAVITNNIDITLVPKKIENEDKKIKRYIIYNIVKRVVDIIGGFIGIVFLIPITIVISIARIITKENDGPLFYEQLRIGKNGKQFRLYKYRSMVVGADDILSSYLAENEEARKEYKKYKKLKKDPRITKVGNFMRKFSIDEFPQFINVLKGQMSLVGPRPYLPREKSDMGDSYNTIITVKPGITGYWQVNGRNDIDFEERTQMDVEYIKNRNLWSDFKIIIKTVTKILKKEGA